MKGLLIALLLICASLVSSAQNPFKRLPKPEFSTLKATSSSPYVFYRFSGPIAGYDVANQAIGTGLSFGPEWDKFTTDSSGAGSWYTTFSIKAVAFVQGNIPPNEQTVANASFGIRLAVLNDLFGVSPVFDTHGKFGFYINFSAALH